MPPPESNLHTLVELSRDLAQRSSGLALGADVIEEVRREDTRPSPVRPLRPRSTG
jgi:hypothetical protein